MAVYAKVIDCERYWASMRSGAQRGLSFYRLFTADCFGGQYFSAEVA